MTLLSRLSAVAVRAPILPKLAIMAACLSAGFALIAQPAILAQIAGTILVGVMFAHGVELQHQCVHGLGFKSKRFNRWAGFLLGAPMLVAFSHYRGRHLHHHRFVGTPEDREFFSYDTAKGLSWRHFARDIFGYSRLIGVFCNMSASFGLLKVSDHHLNARAKNEYRILLALAVVVAIAAPWVLVKFWLLPLLLVAEPTHFLIELPEHIFCDRPTSDYAANSRTIEGSWFSRWLTNGNNFHVEHHVEPSLPIERLAERYAATPRSQYRHHHSSYPEFYKSVIASLRAEAFGAQNRRAVS